jgi:uncharacterized protein (TIGR02284 family)
MEAIDNKTTEVLNDLLRINNDRIEGYEKATNEAGDLDLKTLFTNMANESRTYANKLTSLIRNYGGDPATNSTTVSGKIYRAWMDVKTTFTGKDRQSILNACEFGEDAAQSAYRDALATNDLSEESKTLIYEQQAALRKSHDIIKKYRDLQKN